LLEQSQHATEAKLAVQGDGFGVAWYDGSAGPGLYRDVMPAWSDGNLPSLCKMVQSNLFLAHVRASTAAETARINCHPFTHGTWSFMHNGQVSDIAVIRRKLESLLPDDLYNARRGTTDSELIFLLLLARGLKQDPQSAVKAVLAILQEVSVYGAGEESVRMTCVFTDGHRLFAFRHSSDAHCPTLYARHDGRGWVLASEPLDVDARDWVGIAPDALVVLEPGDTTLTLIPLDQDHASNKKARLQPA